MCRRIACERRKQLELVKLYFYSYMIDILAIVLLCLGEAFQCGGSKCHVLVLTEVVVLVPELGVK